MFGYDKDPEGDFAFQQVDGHNTFTELGYMLDAINPGALIIALLSLGILILWERPFITRLPFTKIIKGPLIAVLTGVGLHLAFAGTEGFALTAEQVVNIPVPDSLAGFFGQFTFPDFSRIGESQIWLIGGTIAIVASLETLLCVEATDKLDPEKRVTPTNRELTAQGIGNMISGMIGGLPLTQVIVRSSANIQSGGKTKASAFFHGIMLLISAMTIPHLLNMIPLASLAAILLIVGYKLAKPSLFKKMYNMGYEQFIPFIVTILGIVFTDLLVGIAMGMVVAIFFILYNNYKVPYHFDPKDYKAGEPVRIELSEDVSFLNKASIQRTLDNMPEESWIIVDASKAKSIHPDIKEIFDDFTDHAKTKDIKFELLGLNGNKEKRVNPVNEVQKILPGGVELKKKNGVLSGFKS